MLVHTVIGLASIAGGLVVLHLLTRAEHKRHFADRQQLSETE